MSKSSLPPRDQHREAVVIRFSGDSGDGIQFMGHQFASVAALQGNDTVSFSDFPAEIRAPKGTLSGVSGFQLHFGSRKLFSIGDQYDVLIAMNPAALQKELPFLKERGVIIVDRDSFTAKDLRLAGYNEDQSPLPQLSAQGYLVHLIPVSSLTFEALKDSGLRAKEMRQCRNMFVLGFVYWLYGNSLELTETYLKQYFEHKASVLSANLKVLQKGYHYGETTESFEYKYRVKAAALAPGLYRNLRGNQAVSLALVTAAQKAKRPIYFASYPITPASDILHELVRHKQRNIKTFQAEDEIAAICSAIGASFAGDIAVTATSGPGMSLKTEGIGLAVMLELPLVIINVQRGGPATGLPTKTEQADLFQALFGRHGECPVAVLAAKTPTHCFELTIEAVRIAIKYMTPVILLSDAYIAGGSTPWNVPNVADIPPIQTDFPLSDQDTLLAQQRYKPYRRNTHLGRSWALPGTPNKQHRIGGLEKEQVSGDVSYDPDNHEYMVKLRDQKVAKIEVPEATFECGNTDSLVLLLGWGSTYGVLKESAIILGEKGVSTAHIHLVHLHPLPSNIIALIECFEQVIIPEMNLGQLAMLLKSKTTHPIITYQKVKGQPFRRSEIIQKVLDIVSLA